MTEDALNEAITEKAQLLLEDFKTTVLDPKRKLSEKQLKVQHCFSPNTSTIRSTRPSLALLVL
jgi:hypothetical protein